MAYHGRDMMSLRMVLHFDSVREVASWITPVPGGVVKMTITMLLQNTLEAAERAEKKA